MFSALVTAPAEEIVSRVLQSRGVHRNQTALEWPDPKGRNHSYRVQPSTVP